MKFRELPEGLKQAAIRSEIAKFPEGLTEDECYAALWAALES